MKSIYKTFAVLFALAFWLQANAQQNDSAYLKYTIKTNVLQWIMNEPNLVFEYRFSQKFGLESTLGTYGIYNRKFSYFGIYSPLPQSGIVLRVNPKLYFKLDPIEKKRSYYFSPMLLFKLNEATGWFGDLSGHVYKKEKKLIIGPSFLLGYQSVFAKNLIIDFYLGGGFRYRNLETTYYNMNGSTSPYDPRTLPKTDYFEEWQPSIHLGLKLGFGFTSASQ